MDKIEYGKWEIEDLGGGDYWVSRTMTITTPPSHIFPRGIVEKARDNSAHAGVLTLAQARRLLKKLEK